jgi:hypothetical protein
VRGGPKSSASAAAKTTARGADKAASAAMAKATAATEPGVVTAAAAATAPPAPPSPPGGGILTDENIGRLVFFLAMILLGTVAGVIYLNHQPSATTGSAGGHHTLDSPYAAQPFFRGAAQAQSGLAAGHSTARNLSFAYLTAGYQWFSLTDVNTATPAKQYDTAGLLTVAGQQVQYPFGSFLAYGVDRFLTVDSAQKAIDWIHGDAGAAFLAAPMVPPTLDFASIRALHGLDGIQIFNARTARDQPTLADATALWDRLLTSGDRVWGLVGDDTLDASGPMSTLGKTSVDIQAPTLTAVLVEAALKQGAFVDSTGVRVLGVSDDNETITVVTTNATEIKFIGAGGKVLQVSHGSRGDYHLHWNEGYVRAEATRASDGAKAWTQPIFVNP